MLEEVVKASYHSISLTWLWAQVCAWIAAVPGVVSVLASPPFQLHDWAEAHGAVWQLLLPPQPSTCAQPRHNTAQQNGNTSTTQHNTAHNTAQPPYNTVQPPSKEPQGFGRGPEQRVSPGEGGSGQWAAQVSGAAAGNMSQSYGNNLKAGLQLHNGNVGVSKQSGVPSEAKDMEQLLVALLQGGSWRQLAEVRVCGSL